jgi:hypothetical protein
MAVAAASSRAQGHTRRSAWAGSRDGA